MLAKPLILVDIIKTCGDGRDSAEVKDGSVSLDQKMGERSWSLGHPLLPKAHKNKEGMRIINTAKEVFPSTREESVYLRASVFLTDIWTMVTTLELLVHWPSL